MLPALLRALGFRQSGLGAETSFTVRGGRRNGNPALLPANGAAGKARGGKRKPTRRRVPAPNPASPFAALARLKLGR
jgi:hypothetical protein